MPNALKIKRAGISGSLIPVSLAEGELAYSENSKNFFIGTNGGADIQIIGGKAAIDKLASIAENADVTNTTSVDAAGAVMNTDTSAVDMQFVIDEDDMASNLNTKVPTQQSVKSYVDGRVSSGVVYKGSYDAATNTPALDATPIATSIGDMYTVTVAGDFFTIGVEVGDVIISEIDNAAVEADWSIVNKNLDAASIKSAYESNTDTNEYSDAEKAKVANVAVTQPVDLDQIEADTITNNAKETNTVTNISVGAVTATTIPILSSDGTGVATIPAATATLAGAMISGPQAFGGPKIFEDISGADAGAVLDSFVIDGGTF